ncbi:hypothetical protein RJ640_013851 [Escallonia rubra]|uniref:Uncharacterized protein n=1 Tax=Escallonia rubra TaxID=112253 RepID=A0AA88UV15_9ASTE|nr:hypothetical protein RJ640_013851 [Escallonia rubra]
MENTSQLVSPGSRQLNLKRSFEMGTLKACGHPDPNHNSTIVCHPSTPNVSATGIRVMTPTMFVQDTSFVRNRDFFEAFPTFTNSEQERLYRLFLQVITSLRENAQDEFESTCIETQVGSTLDTVEQLVEEQNLDPLFPNKTNIRDTAHSLSAAKKDEIQYLTSILKKAEEQKNINKARIELLKKEGQDFSGAVHVVEKLRTGILNYGTGNSTAF